MTTVFLLGDSLDVNLNKRVRVESEQYNDIVQQSFHDKYDNLTLKTILLFKWSSEYCPKAQLFLKIDDDVLFNTKEMSKFLTPILNDSLVNTFICRVAKGSHAIRDPMNKWYLPFEEYNRNILPTFCLGPAYMFTSDLSPRLYQQSLVSTRIRLEDVFVGTLANKLNSKFIDIFRKGIFNHPDLNVFM